MGTFFLPATVVRPPPADPNDVGGEDVAFGDGMTIENGDWKAVRRDDAAVQSVRRETISNPGSLAFRSDWGAGAGDVVFRGITRSASDGLLSRVRNRTRLNPRVGKVVDVTLARLLNPDGTAIVDGQQLKIEFVPAGGQRSLPVFIGPKR